MPHPVQPRPKVETARRGFRTAGLLLALLGAWLTGCKSGQKVNQWSDGRYYSAREIAVLKKQERQRHREALKHGKELAAQQRAYETAQARQKTASRRNPAPRPATPSPETNPATTTPALPASEQTRELIRIARTYTGTPYVGGGTTRMGMDCSGLLCTTFAEAGYGLPRTSNDQSTYGPDVAVSELQPGDLVFFATDGGGSRRISHVGMVTDVRRAKGNQEVLFIHASSSLGVKEDNLAATYWTRSYVKAVRPPHVPKAVAPVANQPQTAPRTTFWQWLLGH